MPSMAAPPAPSTLLPREIALALISLAAIVTTQAAWIPATNFTGFDEWLIVDLVSRGIIDVPHGNRPVHLLWLLPAAFAPGSLKPYVVLHWAYTLFSGALAFLICRRLAPGHPLLWFSTAVFSVVWGPGDLARLSTLERVGYTAFECATLLAIWLLVESWKLRSTPVLAFGILAAFLAARSYEAVVPLLACAPLLLAWPRRERGDGRFRNWVFAWEGVIALAIVLIVLPRFLPSDVMAYQLHVLGLDMHPIRVASRLKDQYLFHLAPLVVSPLSELAISAVPIAVAVFLASLAAWNRLMRGAPGGPESRAFLARAMLVGLAWAGLGYGILVLTPSQPTGLRMQFLSAPGIALLLAGSAALLATFAPFRRRAAVVGLLGAWIVAVGTGRSLAMQKTWDAGSAYPAQRRMLSELTRQVPDVERNTLIVLIDDGRVWRATYGFHHAVSYLYERRASGCIWGAWNALYPARFSAAGIVLEPWPSLRKPWGVAPTLHRWDETLVVRHGQDGAVEVLSQWPAHLPPLPPGATYAPQSRIVRGGPPPPERAILQ